MQKILVNGKVHIFLDHRKLINKAYHQTGSQEYELQPEVFEFNPKESRNDYNACEISRKRRKKQQAQKTTEINKNSSESFYTHLSEVTAALKSLPHLLPSKVELTPITRFWEDISANDFPKFKGANSTSSFQLINKLVEEVMFLVPPHCRFYNYDIAELKSYIDELPAPFDLIVMDPPWRNKYIRRLKRHQLGYSMLESKQLQDIPLEKVIHERSIVAIWCTNSKQHQEALIQQLLPSWGLRLLHSVKWLKVNTVGEPIGGTKNSSEENGKQPFEMLYIACHDNAENDFGTKLKEVEMLISVPSIIHSHKPPLLDWLRDYFPLDEFPKCLELFARYLQPNFTSFGLEVLKLMDRRLYTCKETRPEVKDD